MVALILVLQVAFLGGVPDSALAADGTVVLSDYTAPNLIGDSNVSSQPTEGPDAFMISSEYCNTNSHSIYDVSTNVGTWSGTAATSTPGVFETVSPPVGAPYVGTFQIEMDPGVGNPETRFLGELEAGDCVIINTIVRYDVVDVNNDPVWGASNTPDDDLTYRWDYWATWRDPGADGLVGTADDTTEEAFAEESATVRNEITAASNKIGTATVIIDPSPTVSVGETVSITYEGVDFGNPVQGFDSDNDGKPDYDLWFQAIGESSLWDPDVFQLVSIDVTLFGTNCGGGNPDVTITASDRTYFKDLDQYGGCNWTGTYTYTFVAISEGSSTVAPYQEVASGSDNEKYNADYCGDDPAGSPEFCVTLTASGVNLVLSKFVSPTDASPGDTLTWNINYVNPEISTTGDPDSGFPVSIDDVVPAGTTYVAGSAQCGVLACQILYSTDPIPTAADLRSFSAVEPSDPTTVTYIRWLIDEPIVGGTDDAVSFQSTVDTGTTGFVSNHAELTIGGHQPPTTTATTAACVNACADLAIDKDTLTSTASAGGTATYVIVVENSASITETALGVVVFDLLPSGFTYASTTSIVLTGASRPTVSDPVAGDAEPTWSAFDITPGGSVEITFVVDIDPSVAAGTYDNTATASAGETVTDDGTVPNDGGFPIGADPENDEDVTIAGPVLLVDKDTTTATSIAGGQASYTIVVSNEGSSAATGVSLVDNFPSVWTFASSTVSESGATRTAVSDPSAGDPIATWGTWTIDPGGSVTVTVAVDIPATALDGTYDNTVVVTAANHVTIDDNGLSGQDSDTPLGADPEADEDVTLQSADVSVLKTDLLDPVPLGQNIIYEIVVTSNGALDATGVVVTDQLPGTFISSSTTLGTCSVLDGTLTCSLGDMTAGTTATITIEVASTTTVSNTASVTTTSYDGNPFNDSDGEFTTVTADPIVKTSDGGGSVVEGETITYTIVVNNQSGSTWSDIAVSDPLPAGTSAVPGSTQVTVTDTTTQAGSDDFSTNDLLGGSGWNEAAWIVAGSPDASSGAAVFDTSADGVSRSVDLFGVESATLSLDYTYAGFDGTESVSIQASDDGITWTTLDDITPADPSAGTLSFNVLPFAGSTTFVRVTADSLGGSGPSNADDRFTLDNVLLSGTSRTTTGPFTEGDPPDLITAVDGYSLDDRDYLTITYQVVVDDPASVTEVSNTATLTATGLSTTETASVTDLVQPKATIGDLVWLDADNDGVRDGTEPGIDGVTVSLYLDDGDGIFNAGDTLVTSVATAGGGAYDFTGLDAGTYWVDVDDATLGAATISTTSNDPLLVTIAAGDDYNLADFGYAEPAAIGDFTWVDSNGNGIQDGGEPGLDGVTVRLYEASDLTTAIATTSTSGGGAYQFTGLTPGTYVVEFDVTAAGAYTLTMADVGSDLADSDPGPTTGRTGGVAVASGETNSSVDAGAYLGATIGDFVWYDADGDGVQDAGEPGLDGVTVDLYDSTGTSLVATTTTVDGAFAFANVAPGEYLVVVDATSLPSSISVATFDSDGGLDSQTAVSVLSGDTVDTVDFGYRGAATLGDYVWFDADADGVQDGGETGILGVTVTATWYGFDGVLGGGDDQLFTTVTDAAGAYLFSYLPDGIYDITVDVATLPDGITSPTFDANGGLDSTSQTTIAAGVSDLSQDFGYTGTGAIGDYVWFDADSDGLQDAGELPLSSVTVTATWYGPDGVLGGGDDVVYTTVTDADGLYAFGDLPDGTFVVAVSTATLPNGITAATSDRDVTPDGTTVVTLDAAGVNIISDADFGFTGTGSIGDFVWSDDNADGIQDVGESGLAGVDLTVTWLGFDGVVGGGDDIAYPVTTDGAGSYDATALPSGNFTVDVDEASLPSGFALTTGNEPLSVTLAVGQDHNSADFGYQFGTDLSLTKVDTVDPIADSGSTSYTLTVTNLGPSDATGVVVTDTLPAGLTFDAAGSSASCLEGPVGSITCTIGNLANGASTSVTVAVDAVAGTSATVTNSATVTMNEYDSDPTNDTATEDTTIYIPATISDLVWYDVDGDGVLDVGEPGLAGVTIWLYDSTGTVLVDAQVSDANGNYAFVDLAPNTYTVVVDDTTLPGGVTATFDADGIATVDTAVVTVISNEINTTTDFGYTGTGSIGDFVFEDTDGDGVQDSGETAGLTGAEIQLTWAGVDGILGNGDDYLFTTQTTMADGAYDFTNLPAGLYEVDVLTDPAGYVLSTANDPTQYNLAAAEDYNDADFGYYQTVTIGDYVWVDLDGDGLDDAGEQAYSGMDVTLIDLGADGVLGGGDDTTIGTVTTDATGAYSFTGVAPGDYAVIFDTADGALTLQDQGVDDTIDSDPDSATGIALVTVTSGVDNTDVDAGVLPATIGDTVWVDMNADGMYDSATEPGLEGATVNLYDDVNFDGIPDGPAVATTTTAVDGTYSFTVAPGDYLIEVVATGSVFTTQDVGGDDAVDSDVDAAGLTGTISVVSGETNTDVDAGVLPSILGDLVWIDTNGDGVYDVGTEAGLDGVTVNLYDASDLTTPIATTITSGGGSYSFTVAPGDYVVEVVAPIGYDYTIQDAAAATEATDSDVDATGHTSTLSISGSTTNNVVDAGLIGAVTIGDLAFADVDGDGIYTAGTDTPLAGVAIDLYDSTGTVLLDSLITDATGAYSFTVVPDTYVITYSPPVGYVETAANQGADDTIDSDPAGGTVIVDVADGLDDTTVDAGFHEPVAIGDLVYFDTDGDGVYTAGTDVPLSGVTVDLTGPGPDGIAGNGDDVSLTTTTDGSGLYSFTGLVPGTYTVDVDETTLPYGLDTATADAEGAVDGIATVTTVSGEINNDVDFGYEGSASIGDFVWSDTDSDGVQDTGEPGLVGVDLTITWHGPDGNLGGGDDVVYTTTTDGSGLYDVTGLPAGEYTVDVTEATLPAGVLLTTTEPLAVSLLAAQDYNDADFGYAPDYQPVLTVTKVGSPNPATVGDDVAYTYTVTHDATSDGSAVSSVTIVDSRGLTLTFTGGDTDGDTLLDGGESWTWTATETVTPSTPDPLDNTATVDGTDINGQAVPQASDTESVDIDWQPELAVSKSGPASALVGDTVTYSFAVTNDTVAGDGSPVTVGAVTDDVAGAATSVDVAPVDGFNDGDTNLNGLLEPGETWLYQATYTITPTDTDPLSNTVTVTGTDADGEAVAAATDTHSLDVLYAPVLAAVKSSDAGASVTVGQTVTYTFAVSHDTLSDGSAVSSVVVADDVLGTISGPDSGDDGDGILEAGETWIYSATYVVPADAPDPLVNNVTADGTDLDGEAAGQGTDSLSLPVEFAPALIVIKVGSPDPATVGDTVTYTYTVSHDLVAGDGSPVAGVAVVDSRGLTLTFTGGDIDGDTLLDDGETWTWTATETVTAATPDPLDNTVTVDGTDRDGEAIPQATASESVDIDWQPVLAIDKTGPASALAGSTVTYDITVTHDATSDQTPISNVVVTDPFGTVTFTGGDSDGDNELDFGESWTYTVVGTLPAAPDPYTNTASVEGTDLDNETVGPVTDDHVIDVIQPATISDFVFEDVNGDGIYTAGTDTPLAGVVVNLYDTTGTILLATTTTVADGLYAFTGLAPDTYVVEFVGPATYLLTDPDQGADDSIDSDPSPADAGTGTVTVSVGDGELNDTIDAGYYAPMSIGDFVYYDVDGDGVYTAGTDVPLEGATVTLYDATGTVVIATTTSDATGAYSFDNLAPDTYTITATEPSGMTTTDDRDGTADGSTVVTTTSGTDVTDADFGLTGTGTIGDQVFEDVDNDGIYTLGTDVPLAGVTVTTTWFGIDGIEGTSDDVTRTTTTAADGTYSFGNLPAGGYTVDADESTTGLTAPTATTADPASVPLAAGEVNNDIDFGYYVPGAVSDRVWNDLDGDGVQDAGEPGLAGVVVNLVSDPGPDGIYGTPDDVVVATDTTDALGAYSLTAVPGDYTVVFLAPADYVFTTPDNAGDDLTDSDALVTADPTVAIASVTLVSGVDDPTVDAGLYAPVTIGDFVWVDLDSDGLQDGGEPGWEGMTVTLTGTDGSGNVVSLTTTTDASGAYSFTDVAPGTYTVTFDPTGVVFTTQDAGDDALDSDADAAGLVAVTVTSGVDDSTIDAGIAPAVISGTVLDDAQADGLQDGADVPIAGVTVDLWEDTTGDGVADTLVATTTSDVNGDYSFSVPPGDYAVVVDTSGYLTSPQDVGGDDSIDSDIDATGTTATMTATSGSTTDLDALLYTQATISDLVWVDLDADGIQDLGEPGLAGVTVSLFVDADQDGVADGPALATTPTDADGLYSFTVDPGHYLIVVDGTGFTFTAQDAGTDDAIDSDVDGAGTTGTITVTSGELNDSTDAGVLPALISDFVWNDLDADGIQDGGETGIENVTVNLWADTTGDGNPDTIVATDTTDATGAYELPAAPGTYFVEFDFSTTAEPYVISPQDQGGDDTLDSDADPATGQTSIFTIVDGTSDDTIDVGAYLGATVSDFVWHDLDGDGVQDAGEPGLAGVAVNLVSDPGTDGIYGTTDDVVVATDTTDAAGLYTLSAPPGTYEVVVLAPADYAFTASDQGGDDTLDSDVTPTADPTVATVTTTLTSGEFDDTVDAGLYDPVTISGTVWFDIDADSTLAGEPGLEGVTVTLYDATGTVVIATTTTAADGSYSFIDVPPGDYNVTVDTATLPDGMTETYDLNGGLDSTTTLTVTSGTDEPAVDFGYTGTGSIGDFVFEDIDGDGVLDAGETAGVAGAEIQLTWAGPDGLFGTSDDVVYPPQTTDGTGAYDFTLLPAGEYSVDIVTEPAGYTLTTANDPLAVTLAVAEDYTDADFGYAAAGIISDFVWDDLDGDGIQDAGEPGIEGVVVDLVSDPGPDGIFGTSDDVIVATDTTDALGAYSLTALPGDYTVVFSASAGTEFTTPDQGGDDTLDSDPVPTADPSVATVATSVASGENDDTIDAGLYEPATIGDTVFEDLDGDGVQEVGEDGLAGIEVQLIGAGPDGILGTPDDVVLDTQTTDGNGNYLFGGVAPGEYLVSVLDTTVPAGYTDTTTDPRTVIVSSGDTVTVADFGLLPPSSMTVVKDPATQNVVEGGDAVFTVTITNTGGTTLTNIIVSDPLATCDTTSVASLAAGASAVVTCTTTNVTADFTNTVTVTADSPAGVLTESDTADVVVLTSSILIVKDPASQNVVEGGDAVFTVTVTNDGQTDLTNVTVTDALATCDVTSVASLPVGANQVITCTTSGVTADFTNTVDVTAEDPIGTVVASSDTADVVVLTPSFTVTKDPATQDVPLNGDAVFTVTVTNTGETDLFNVTITDALATCDVTSIAVLPVGASQVITCTTNGVTSDFTNTVDVTAEDPIGTVLSGSDTADVTVLVPGVAITKSPATQFVVLGDTATFDITVTNTGALDLTNVTVSDPLAPGCDAFFALIPVGGSETYTCTQSPVTADYVNTATATATDTGGNVVTGSDTAAVDMIDPSITITKTPDLSYARSGDTVTFTIEVTNTGDVDLTNIVVSDPATSTCDATFASMAVGVTESYACTTTATADFTNVASVIADEPSGGTVGDSDTADVDVIAPAVGVTKSPATQQVIVNGIATFDITVTNLGDSMLTNVVVSDPLVPDCDATFAALAMGETQTYTCTVSPVTADFTNTATVTADDLSGQPVGATDTADVTVVAGALDIQKTPNLQTILENSTATFDITVTNGGTIDLFNVTVSDPLAPDCDNPVGTLAAGASITYSCTLSPVPADFTNTATVTAEDTIGNVLTDNDTADVDVIVPAISVSKTPDLQTVVTGGDAIFTIAVTNDGDADLTDAIVTDPLVPACDTTIATLVVGETVTYNCTLTNVVADMTNTVNVTADEPSGGSVSATDTADVTVLVGGIEIQKTPDYQIVGLGGDATFDITVTNTGETDLTNVIITDPLVPACDTTVATLAVGATTTYSCTFSGVTGDFTNTASVTADDPLGNTVSDSDTADVDLVNPGLTVSKTPDLQTLLAGETANFTITVTNTGDVDLTNVVVSDLAAPGCDTAFANLAVGATETITCSVLNVLADFTNTATVTADTPLGTTITVSDDAAVDVVFPGIDIQKTPDTQQVLAGDTVTFSIQVTNTGTEDLVNVAVSDSLAPDCDSVIGALAVGASVTYTCTVTGETADFTNIASVTGEDTFANPVSDSDDAVVDFINPALAVSKTPDVQTVVYDGTATFTISVTNTGDVELTNVAVTDPPAPDCDATFATLAAGETQTYTCTVTNVTADFTNTVNAGGDDPLGNSVPATDTGDVTVLVPGVEIQKTPDFQQVTVGDTATFTITVTNTGQTDLVDIVVTDPLAPDCDRVISSLAVGETTSYTCTVTVSADFTNTASVTADDPLGNPWTDSDTADVDAIAPSLFVTKSPDVQSVPLGSMATFTIEVTNDGDVDLTNVTVTDPVSPSCDNTLALLAAGTTWSYTCTATVSADFTNTASVTGLDPNGVLIDGGSDIADVTALLPGVLVEKTPDTQAIGIGQDATFTITVTNIGDVTLDTVDVVDAAYPACDSSVGPLAPGASTSYSCTVTDVLADFTNTADATGTDGNGNTVTSTDTADVTVLPGSISITKVADSATVVDGGDVTYTITVTNDGPADLLNVTVTDSTLPACDATFATMLAGETQTYSCTVSGVDAAVLDPIVNTIDVTADDEAGNPVADSDTETVDVLVPEVSVFKNALTPTILEGGDATFEITVINTGETDLINVTVSDPSYPVCDNLFAALAIGEIQTYTCVVSGETADFSNNVTVMATDPIGGTTSDTATASVTVTPTGDLSGFVFTDEDGDGVYEPADGDAPIANVDVIISDGVNAPYVVTTDSTGGYTATLPVGDYTVDVDETDADFPTVYEHESTGTDGQTVTVDDIVPVVAAPIGYAPAGDVVGSVWDDLDGDGIQDAGEPGEPGVIVNLWEDTDNDGVVDTVVATTTTDANGDYAFLGVPDGDYAIEVVATDFSPQDQGADDTVDSDVDPTSGISDIVTVTPGSTSDLDAGTYTPVTIGDLVFVDLDADGTLDAGEPGMADVTVTATDTSDGTVYTTTTDANGAYSFTLPPGSYDVAVTEPAGTTVTTANDPTNLTLASGDVDNTVDFGIDGAATFTGVVVWDINADATLNATDDGLDGITVTATWAGPDGVFGTADDVVYTTVTAIDGSYVFTDLPPGDYTVTVDETTLPGGMIATFDPDGGLDGLSALTLAPADSVSQDFGYTGLGSIGDLVWLDVDGDGIQASGEPHLVGVTIDLIWYGRDGLRGTGDDVVLVAVTQLGAGYSVANLPAGAYAVEVDVVTLPAGTVATYDLDLVLDDVTEVLLGSGESFGGADFGYTGTGSIGDTVFLDLDLDGVQDASEPGVAGVTVVATWVGPDGVAGSVDDVTAAVTTNADGRYLIENAPAGEYTLALDPTTLPPTSGGALPITVVLEAGEDHLDADFGLGGNLPPLAVDDSASTLEDTAVAIVVLGNDGDPEGHQVFVESVTQPANGAVAITADGVIVYVPDSEFSGVDTFTYTICEDLTAPVNGVAPTGECSTATVTVTVSEVNDPPALIGDPILTVVLSSAISALPIVDAEGAPLVFRMVGGSLPPGVTLNPDGTFSGLPNRVGTYTIVVEVCEVGGQCVNLTLAIEVTDPSAVPALPKTGYDTDQSAAVGVFLVIAGLVLLYLTRRRPDLFEAVPMSVAVSGAGGPSWNATPEFRSVKRRPEHQGPIRHQTDDLGLNGWDTADPWS